MVRAFPRYRALQLALVTLTVGGLVACTPDLEAPGTLLRSQLAFDENPSVPDEDMRALASGQLELAADLLAGIPGNAALSPVSINVAFSMLSAGARGQTLAELEEGLRLLPQDQLHLAHNALELALRDRDVPPGEGHDGVTLQQANQVFAALDFRAEDAFLDVLGQRYDAGVRLLDFQGAPEDARKAINQWVSNITREKIDELLPPGAISEATRLALVNALYLKASWRTPFEESATSLAPFRLANGTEVQVPTLHGGVLGRHGIVGGVEVVAVPFLGELALVVAVPRDATEAEAIAALRSDALASVSLDLALPKFSVRSELSLRSALEALGVEALFDAATCDLSGINDDEDLFVSAAVHEAVVDLNERGVEAAAATAILVETSGVADPVTVTIDEPFVFAIIDGRTTAPLFVGRVVDPR